MSRAGSQRSTAKPTTPTARIAASDTTVLSKADYERIKAASQIVSPQQMAQQRKSAEETRAAQLAAARARKERIISMESERTKNAPLSELQIEAKENREKTLAQASSALVEERDEVKKMNEMVRYAKCASVRERQLDEKKQAAQEVVVEDRAWAALMEADRVKALAAREEEEREKVVKRHADALVLRQQIHDRETQRLREEEQLQREREALLKRIEAENKVAAEKEVTRREAGRRMLEEGARANVEAAEQKEKEKLHEKVEELRIVQYIREKEERERQYEEEQKQIKAEKELEVCRLRALQEKAIDKQAIRDALLARRAQEKYERDWRAKEKAEAEKIAAMQADLARAREQQIRAKEVALVEAAQLEKVEFERTLSIQRQKAEEEEQHQRAIEERTAAHAAQVRHQIESARERFERERAQKLTEGDALRRKMARDKEEVERARQEKLAALREQGIPEKYMAELVRSKF